MKFNTQYCQSNCLHRLSWYVHNHNYMNMIQYELFLSSSMLSFKNNHNKSNSQNQQKLNMKNHEKKFENNIFKSFLEICQIQAELFYMLTWKWNHEIFAIIMKDIEKTFKLKSYADSWLIVFEKYHNLINVFEKQNINKLSSHWKKYDIEINLKLKKTLNFEFLYNMLQNEFQMLQ